MDYSASSRVRWGTISLDLSGVFFLLFPAARPFLDEMSMEGAVQFASVRWQIAHSSGIVGFILMALGLLGLNMILIGTAAERGSFRTMVLYWIGAGLTLPFFGAEAFSLQVIGQAALDQNSTTLLPLVNRVRFGPGISFIAIGLILIAIAAIILASTIRRSHTLTKWSGVPLAVGVTVYIPLLQGAPVFQPIRIVDGLLIAARAIWIAWAMAREHHPP